MSRTVWGAFVNGTLLNDTVFQHKAKARISAERYFERGLKNNPNDVDASAKKNPDWLQTCDGTLLLRGMEQTTCFIRPLVFK